MLPARCHARASGLPLEFNLRAAAGRGAYDSAYRPDLTYQRADLLEVVAFAADRAIRVVPEIDMPGHAGSFGLGRPGVVVDCAPE